MPKKRFLNLKFHKKNSIEKAIIDEMMRAPYEYINLSNIIRDAKISRGSFYEYFSNKNDFYYYILKQLGNIKSSFIDVETIQDESIPFLDKLAHVLEASIIFSKSFPNFVQIGIQLYASAHQEIESYISQSKKEMTLLFKKWLIQDPVYSKMENQESLIQYISDSMLYLTQFMMKFNTMEQLENHLYMFMKILKGGIQNV